MQASYVKLKAATAAVLLRATTSAVEISALVTLVVITIAASVGAPWDGYAYDYFAEDYTVTT